MKKSFFEDKEDFTVTANNLIRRYENRFFASETELMEIQEKASRNQIQIEILKEANDEITKDIVRMEKDIVVTNQYNRRPNLVIDGIPDNIPQAELEGVCLDIIHEIGFLPVGSYEVVACHRLRKKEGDSTAPTIIRFVNRKVTEFCLKNRWRLKNLRTSWKLSFREDLCDDNLDILHKCEKLQNEGFLHKVFTHNGFVKVIVNQGERPKKINHILDLHDLLL